MSAPQQFEIVRRPSPYEASFIALFLLPVAGLGYGAYRMIQAGTHPVLVIVGCLLLLGGALWVLLRQPKLLVIYGTVMTVVTAGAIFWLVQHLADALWAALAAFVVAAAMAQSTRNIHLLVTGRR